MVEFKVDSKALYKGQSCVIVRNNVFKLSKTVGVEIKMDADGSSMILLRDDVKDLQSVSE